jgi:TonB family protein
MHGLLMFGLTRVLIKSIDSVELTVTEVTLERLTSEAPTPVPTVQAVPASRALPTRESITQQASTQRIMTQVVNPQVVKPAAQATQPTSVPQETSPVSNAQSAASEPVSKPVLSSNICSKVAFKPRSNTAKYDLEKSVMVVITAQRTASGRVTSPRIASGSGRNDLDAYALRLASQYTLKSNADCEGHGIKIPVQFNPS